MQTSAMKPFDATVSVADVGECLMRLRRALDEMVAEGIETTPPLFRALVSDPPQSTATTTSAGSNTIWQPGSPAEPARHALQKPRGTNRAAWRSQWLELFSLGETSIPEFATRACRGA
jgi:hypothetical protein